MDTYPKHEGNKNLEDSFLIISTAHAHTFCPLKSRCLLTSLRCDKNSSFLQGFQNGRFSVVDSRGRYFGQYSILYGIGLLHFLHGQNWHAPGASSFIKQNHLMGLGRMPSLLKHLTFRTSFPLRYIWPLFGQVQKGSENLVLSKGLGLKWVAGLGLVLMFFPSFWHLVFFLTMPHIYFHYCAAQSYRDGQSYKFLKKN